MLFLEAEDPEKDISIYINSPGGSINRGAGHPGHDAFREAGHRDYSASARLPPWRRLLLAAGDQKASAFSLPNSRIMIHQPSMQGLAGQATEIDIYCAGDSAPWRETLNKLLADATGQPGGPRSGAMWIATTSWVRRRRRSMG